MKLWHGKLLLSSNLHSSRGAWERERVAWMHSAQVKSWACNRITITCCLQNKTSIAAHQMSDQRPAESSFEHFSRSCMRSCLNLIQTWKSHQSSFCALDVRIKRGNSPTKAPGILFWGAFRRAGHWRNTLVLLKEIGQTLVKSSPNTVSVCFRGALGAGQTVPWDC